MPVITHYSLRIYQDDDETLLLECSTDPAHAQPSLERPSAGADSRVELLDGRSVIGQINVELTDHRRDPNDQGSGWLTYLLASPAGYNRVIGRRAVLRRHNPDGSVVLMMDGVVSDVQLREDLISYSLALRDIRERERKIRLFATNGHSAVLPSRRWYGDPPVPADLDDVIGLRGITVRFTAKDWAFVNLLDYDDPDANRPLAETKAVQTTKSPKWVPGRNRAEFPYLEFWWRKLGTATWHVLRDMPSPDIVLINPLNGGSLFPDGQWYSVAEKPSSYTDEDGATQTVTSRVVRRIYLHATDEDTVPADDDQVDVLVHWIGATSEEFPYMPEGEGALLTEGQFLAEIYDGLHSEAPLRVRYNQDALDALDTFFLARITKPAEDARKWLEEEFFQPRGLAPALDGEWRVAPISLFIPPGLDAEDLPHFQDSNTETASWKANSEAINHVELEYQRRYGPAWTGPAHETPARADGNAEWTVIEIHRQPDSIALLGEKTLKIETETMVGLGSLGSGLPLPGGGEAGSIYATALANALFQRAAYGTAEVGTVSMHNALGNPVVGAFVRVTISWLPDYATYRRGGTRIMQILGVKELDSQWSEYTLQDVGAPSILFEPPDSPIFQPPDSPIF
jgi:hypothetical protein